MINNKDDRKPDDKKPDDSVKATASAHVLIKYKDTGKVIRNQRG